MLIWLMNLGFAAGGAGSPPDPVAYSGPYKTVFIVSSSGRTKWVDYLPVTYVTPGANKTGTWDDDGALAVDTLASASGLTAWVDYIPVVEVVGTGRNRHDDTGYLAVVEIT